MTNNTNTNHFSFFLNSSSTSSAWPSGFTFSKTWTIAGADEEGGPGYAGDRLAVHRLVAQKIEALDEHLVGVGEQRVLNVVLFGELLLRLYRVAGDAKDNCAGLLQLCELIAESAGLDGAAGRAARG